MNHKGEDSNIVLIYEDNFINSSPTVTSWTITPTFIIVGTLTGSLIVYSIKDTTICSVLAFDDLMEPITCLIVTDNSHNNILMGTKKGLLNVVSLNIINSKVHDNELDTLSRFDDEIIEIHQHFN